MIYPYVGDWLISPVPLQLSFNFCSHKCSYCFANLNNPNREFDVKGYQDQIKGLYNQDDKERYTRNDLQSILLREKYPVLISNLVDPFATSNYQYSIPIMEQLTQMGVPVALQTRGGRGIDDALSFLPPTLWYISIPFLSDELRKQFEPAAPSIDDRLSLISKLKAKGHEVVVGVNPTLSNWLPNNDSKELLNMLWEKGVTGIWVAAFHLNTKQIKVMPDKDKDRLGITVINKGLKNARNLQEDCFTFIDELKDYAHSLGMDVEGLFEGERNDFFAPYKKVYKKLFPTVHDFINWCHDNKQDNEPVYFDEFVKVMRGFPKGEFNLSPYMNCMSQKLVKDKNIHYKMSYLKLLWLSWNDFRMKRTLDRYWSFKIGVIDTGKELKFEVDGKGNKVYYFNSKGWDDEDEFLIVNK